VFASPLRLKPRTLTAAEEMRLFVGFVVQPFVAAGVAFFAFPFLLLGRDGAGGYTEPTQAAVFWAISIRGRDFSRDEHLPPQMDSSP
jgi:hypothetical protein